MTRKISQFMLVVFCCCTVAGLVSAQTPQATLSGIITDPTGAIIPGAQVTAISAATAQRATVVTNDAGFYVLTQLPIGAYTVEVEKPGFKKYQRTALTLTTGATMALDIQMEVGETSESVTVTGQAALLQTRTSEVGQLIESRTVRDLPLGDRRTLNLVRVTGGATFVSYDSGAKPNFSLAGGRTQSQMFWIDGGSGQNMRLGIGQVDIDPPVETVQEVKILSNNYAAEYGGSAGGVIIATTKSGGNNFHGSLFEYFRNDALDAANFFAPVENGEKIKAPLRYNVFGGTISGPVWFPKKAFGPLGYQGENKTFFFFGYEGAKRSEGQTRTLNVPTLPQRQGDFSASLGALLCTNAAGAIGNCGGAFTTALMVNDTAGASLQARAGMVFDPATTRRVGARTVRDQFAGNQIPLARFDAVARKLLDFYPLPNTASATGANNFRGNFARILDRGNYTAKVDHGLTERDKLNFRYLYNSDNLDFTTVFPNIAAETNNAALRHQHYYYVGYTRILSATVINEMRYTYSNRINHVRSFGLGEPWPSRLGLTGVPDAAFPQIVVPGVTTIGSNIHERRQVPIQQHQFVNNLTITRGRHALKTGVELRPSYNVDLNRPAIAGQFNFTPQGTGLPGAAATGFGLASLLSGFPNAVTLRETEPLDRSSWYLAGFFQDDWTINSALTLNLGMRWETDTPIKDRNNRLNSFDATKTNPVSGTPGVVRFAGVDGQPALPYETDWNNFGPRFGFAWRPFGLKSTVVRGGFGIFFAHPFDHGAPNSASLGFERSASLTSPDQGITAPFLLRNGVPATTLAGAALNDSFGAVRVGTAATTAVTFFERDRASGYAQQFNFGVQHELPGNWLVEASCLGNLSRKLSSPNLTLNQITPANLAANLTTQRDRPFPQFNNVTLVFPTLGISNYHALVVHVERRFAAGFNLNSSYTWAKFLNNTDEGGDALGNTGVYSDYYNRQFDYGPSANDVRHRVTVSSVYELPIGRKKRFLANHWAGRVLGEWSVSGLALLQSGPPFTVTTQTNTTNAFSAGAQRANLLRDPNLPSAQRTVGRWFDTTAFEQPAARTFGNAGRGILRGDGVINFDLSVLKNILITEQTGFQFRVEMINAFNHPNFFLPGAVLGGPGFGEVSSAAAGRSLQLGLRFAF